MTSTLRFGVISDSHVAPAGSPTFRWHDWYRLEDALARLERAVDRCVIEGVDALLLPGDVSHGGDRESLDAVIRVVAAAGRPAWIAGGNHDTKSGPDVLDEALAAAPVGTVRGVRPEGEPFGGIVLAGGHARAMGDRRYETDRPAADWPGAFVVWVSHFPTLAMTQRLADHGLPHAGDALDRAEVEAALVARHAPTLVIAGHLHVRDAVVHGSLLQVSAAALVEPPCEIAIVDLSVREDGVDVGVQCLAVDPPGDGPLPVVVEADTAWRHDAAGWRRVLDAQVPAR